MSKRLHVLVHTMKETEGNRAEKILDKGSTRHSKILVQGFADETQIQKLRAENLIVELIEDVQAEEAIGGPQTLFRASARLDWSGVADGATPHFPSGERPAVPSPGRTGTFSLKLVDPAISLGKILRPVGAQVIRGLANGYFVARLRPSQRTTLDADERVEIAPFNVSPAKKPARELTQEEREAIAPHTEEERDFDLVAHSADRTAEIEAWVLSQGAELRLIGTAPDRVRIRVVDTSMLLDAADQLDAVLDVQAVPDTYLCLDRVRPLVGLLAASDATGLVGPAGPLDGADEIVGIIDGAVDAEHPDLAGRVETIHGPASPPSAHGTHVAGIILGNGSCSAGQFRGIAPGARLKAQALAAGPGGKIDLDVNFRAMLERSYQAGARILNLSFEEAGTPSLYSHRTDELDAFAASRPDALVVVAAGNRAGTERPAYRAAGEVDLESISAPGVAKNALTVGASCSDRTGGGHPAADWNAFAPTHFVTPPTSRAALSGDASMLAAFSGRGWGQGERIKPDLVAPGTNIVAARARGVADLLWAAHSDDYLYSGGTSMAAPIVAGCAALVRQYYRQRGHSAPSGALIRATLANGATWLGGPSAAPDRPDVPDEACANLDQGFGRVDMRGAIGLREPGELLCFVDVGAGAPQPSSQTLSNGTVSQFSEDGERRRFWFRCADGEVDIALCYLDPVPGPSGIVISLTVQPPDGAPRRVGNDRAIKKAYPPFGPAPDRVNTLQVVRLGRISGKVEIQVTALALLGHKAGYALVVRGPIENGVMSVY